VRAPSRPAERRYTVSGHAASPGLRCAAGLAAWLALPAAWSDNAAAGRELFRQQCTLCHGAEPGDGGGGQGPRLGGLYGRPAAQSPGFGYSNALRSAGITWDARTLDRFLASPTGTVPGTAMAMSVARADDRLKLIAYLESQQQQAPASGSPAARAGRHAGLADWRTDAPGRLHRIDIATLPPPYASPSATNSPRLVRKPRFARLQVPRGFKVGVFAGMVPGPRALRTAPNGDVFVSETHAGRIVVLRPSSDGTRAAQESVYAQGLGGPFGLAFYPPGDHPEWLYVAETNRIVRFHYAAGDQLAQQEPEVVVPKLSPNGTYGHSTRDLAFSPDGRRMYVSVGSASNVAQDMPRKMPGEIRDWEDRHGLGAAWGNEEYRADVLVYDTAAPQQARVYASGLRNCVSLTVEPTSGDLWCTTNERDALGDDLVPDYSTRVVDGGFYGWPWYYMGRYEDPRHRDERPDLAGKALVPDVPYQAHSAPLSLVFYDTSAGASAFPREYLGDGFAVLHGSWNRSVRTGHKVVRVRMKDGLPTGEYEDFLVGFIVDDHSAWGRPVGATVASDGSLLISDDGADLIYRISYRR